MIKWLKARLISIFGEDLWLEWLQFFGGVLWFHFRGDESVTMYFGLAAYVFGAGAFRRLRKLQRGMAELAAKLEELKAH